MRPQLNTNINFQDARPPHRRAAETEHDFTGLQAVPSCGLTN